MTATTTHVFRVALRSTVYRDIELPSDRSLYAFAESIVRAFGFDMDHAFGFYPKLTGNIMAAKPAYELFADTGGGTDSRSVKKTTVGAAFPRVGTKMTFLFDYGDEWRFRVELLREGTVEPGHGYPKVLASVGKAPPQYATFDEEE